MPRRLANLAPLFIVLVGFALLAPPKAHAQEWYDLYEKGLTALRNKQAVVAAGLFERAIRKQPTPGENILTYGTNRLPEYYPYLRRAEALAMAGDFDRARKALEDSERSGREPADGRLRVMRLITKGMPPEVVATPQRVAATQRESPRAIPTPVVLVQEPQAPAKPTPGEVSRPAATPLPLQASTDAPRAGSDEIPQATAVSSPHPPTRSEPAPNVVPEDTLLASTPSPLTSSILEVITNPGSADVYLDGEFIGRSDGAGRLVKKGVEPGLHELRAGGVSGYDEVRDDIDVSGETFRRIMLLESQAGSRSAPGTPWPAIILGSALVLVATVLGVWLMRPRPLSPSPDLPATKLGATELMPRGTPAKLEGTTRLRPPPPTSVTATGGTPTVSTSADSSMFGEYRLLEQIGKGGMAIVFRAERRGEIVAVKRPLTAFLSEPEFVERFVREAEIGRTLNHPNIIRIFDKGRVGETPYFTMELVDGETLSDRARREGAFSPGDACRIVKQVAEALDYSHLKGVVHRDLKPSNIMILNSGVVKVMDYGIARSARLEGLTATGAFLGTPEYVAPETAEGGRTDARSDLYSLGVVFYEILTGVRPFVGNTPFATLKKICSEPPTPPSAVRKCPPALEVVVLKLLRKKPDDRYASAEELLNDLNDYLNRAA